MKSLLMAAILFSVTPVAYPQVAMISAGSSDELQTPFGAGAKIYVLNTESQLGAGWTDGKLRGMVGIRFPYRGWDLTLGDSVLTGSGLAFPLRGVSATKSSSQHHERLVVFVGAASYALSTGFYTGVTPFHFGSGVYFTRTFLHDDSLRFETSENVQGSWRTAMQSVSWHNRRLNLGGSGGFLQSTRSINANGSYSPWLRHVTFSGSHTNIFFWAPTTSGEGTSERATVDSLGVAGTFFDFLSIHAGYIHSVADGVLQGGDSVGAGLHFRNVQFNADYFVPRVGPRLLTTNTTWRINRHWSVSSYVSDSSGTWNVNPGFAYVRSEFSTNVGYQVLYFPFVTANRSPFQKVLTVQVSFHAPHLSTINASTVSLPNRKLIYTVSGTSWFAGPIASGTSMEPPRHESSGREQYIFRVVGPDGEPIEGAALFVGKSEIFSDDQGIAIFHSKQTKSLPLRVALKDFSTPTDYELVSCPTETSPGTAPVIITVRRK